MMPSTKRKTGEQAYQPMVYRPDGELPVEDTWVTVTEAAEKTGYNRDYVQRLVQKNWKMPEDERTIRVRKAQFGYLVWMPDLIQYTMEIGRGPQVHKTD